ncbi:type II toxin-antitoxin system RelE/ParE family toxin [Pirellulimonas nuda]|uniref:type II toxin-antitoxin system RelE/ParE family toxin n=1 Tax=Pirellulimonas nuda TaxID=2528009 RepID=UPI0011A608FA|nr:type II toxin-antitoxin system RelE/ParE family toxin [Pirellulimonas nuda]
MRHRVSLTHEARSNLIRTAQWWSEHRDADQAWRWLEGFEAAINGLQRHPQRQPLSIESDKFDGGLRQLNFGLGGRPTHRAVFRIVGEVVEVIAIRHLAQQELSPDDFPTSAS